MNDERHDAAVLLPERGAHGHDALDEAAAGGAVRAETRLAPDDRGSDLPLGMIVRRLHALDVHEREDGAEQREHLAAAAGDARASAFPELEQPLELETHRPHPL